MTTIKTVTSKRDIKTNEPSKDELALSELLLLFDGDYTKTIKKWINNQSYHIIPCLEENFISILTQKTGRSSHIMAGFNAFVYVMIIAEVLKGLKPSEKLMRLFDANIVFLIDKASKYFQDYWSIANKKHLDVFVKVIPLGP